MPGGSQAHSTRILTPSIARGMRAALVAAKKGEGWTSPNPVVGAALEIPGDKSGSGGGTPRLISCGHLRFGGPHAEARLLDRVDRLPAGSVLYVTLEPCCHHGKTSPCVDRVLRARPSRVVVAALDPNPEVSGKGVALLRKAGITVEIGMAEAEALSLALPFHLYHTKGRALVRLKVAATMDSRLSDHRGASRWITGEEARRHAHGERSRSDAVMIGSGTAVADDPELTVRHLSGPQPSRIVVDSRLRTTPDGRLWRAWRDELQETKTGHDDVPRQCGSRCSNMVRRSGNYRMVSTSSGGTSSGGRWLRESRLILATKAGHASARLDEFRDLGWEVWILPARQVERGGGVSMRALTRRAGREGFLAILAEGGPGLAAGLLCEDLVDELILYQAPVILGGPSSWPGVGFAASLPHGRVYERIEETRLGPDLMVHLRRSGLLQGVSRSVHRLD